MGAILIRGTVCVCVALLGLYLFYDRVILSLAGGQIVETIGTITRADEPVAFWYAMIFYGLVSLAIAGVGGWLLWRMLQAGRR